jgi:hypothetical protein
MKDQKDNPQNYDYKIIGLFHTREEASLNEIELHETYDVGKNPRFYNRSKQTSTGYDMFGTTHIVSEATKDKLSEAWKNRPPVTEETRKKLSDSAKNKPPVAQKTKDKISESHKNLPPFTEEHIANISIASKNAWTEERKAKQSATQLGQKREPYSEKAKANMSAAQLGKKRGKYKPKV